MSYLPNGDCRIVHKEYLGEVAGSANFVTSQFRIQPGSTRTFPWLSTIARRYDKYRINKLIFAYETDCSTSTAGTVMLVPDFDSSDSAPTNKVNALSYQESVRGQAWTAFQSQISKQNLSASPQYYTAGGAPPSGTDPKLYQVGNLFLCTQGMASTAVVGELWIVYDITLITPDKSALSFDKATVTASAGLTAAVPLGTAQTVAAFDNLDYTINALGTTLTFNQFWRGNILWAIEGTVLTGATITGGTYVNVLFKDTIDGAALNESLTKGLNVIPGDVLTFTSNATTLTSSVIYLSAA